MSTLIMKFGGTSVGSAEAIEQAADIVLDQAQRWDQVVTVVSAMSGVTDALIRGARTAAAGEEQTYRSIVTDLRVLHYRAIDALVPPDGDRTLLMATVDAFLDEFAAFCHSVRVLGEVTPRAMKVATHTVSVTMPYKLLEQVRLLVSSEGGRLLEEEFAAEVTLTAQFTVEHFPAFQDSLQQLSHGKIEARILSTDEATIMPLT